MLAKVLSRPHRQWRFRFPFGSFLDRQPLGNAFVKTFTNTMLFSLTQRNIEERRWMDPKMRLQYCLNEFNSVARASLQKKFSIQDEWGPSHERMYLVGCYINGMLIATARGQSFADGQMGAAARAQEVLLLDEELVLPPFATASSSELPSATIGECETPLREAALAAASK